MNAPFDPKRRRSSETLEPGRFAVGQPVSRKEDPVLLRGEGRYTDDLNLPGQAYGVMVRSRVAHGILRGIDTAEARAMPGVLAVITADDLKAAGIKTMNANVTGASTTTAARSPHPSNDALATDGCVMSATRSPSSSPRPPSRPGRRRGDLA